MDSLGPHCITEGIVARLRKFIIVPGNSDLRGLTTVPCPESGPNTHIGYPEKDQQFDSSPIQGGLLLH